MTSTDCTVGVDLAHVPRPEIINAEISDDEDCQDDDEEVEETEKCFKLSWPHKTFIGQPGVPNGSVSLTGMEFNPPTQTLMLTTKTIIDGSATYAVSQLSHQSSSGAPAAGGIKPAIVNRGGALAAGGGTGLATLRTRRYRAGLEHHGDIGLASCCGDSTPGELVCAGSDATGRRYGVFRLQALSATSQPVLAQSCGPIGDRLGQFNRPAGCAVDAGCAFVADRLNHRIQLLALPTLAPMGQLQDPRMFRPSHLAVFSDAYFGQRLLLAAHERGVLAFDLATAGASAKEFARGNARRWGGLCVHWGAVLLADQADNCVRVYRYKAGDSIVGDFVLVQRVLLSPLGLCLPRALTTHRWLDLLFLAAHDKSAGNGGNVCILTAQMERVLPMGFDEEAECNVDGAAG